LFLAYIDKRGLVEVVSSFNALGRVEVAEKLRVVVGGLNSIAKPS